MRVEPDLVHRRAMIATRCAWSADDLPSMPLYRRTLTWAMAKKVHAVQWPSDIPELRWLRRQ